MASYDVALYTSITGLKSSNSALKVWISVGGWDAGGEVWSNMVSTSANRAAFIASAIKFMATYAFDGMDIDWVRAVLLLFLLHSYSDGANPVQEYPVASDRGGNAADFANYVTFLEELRAATGTKYGRGCLHT